MITSSEAHGGRPPTPGEALTQAHISPVAMKQFDVVADPFPRSRAHQPFLLALQSDLLSRNLDGGGAARGGRERQICRSAKSNPEVTIEDKHYVPIAQEIVTVRKSVLGERAALSFTSATGSLRPRPAVHRILIAPPPFANRGSSGPQAER
jgi:hypothetical protein